MSTPADDGNKVSFFAVLCKEINPCQSWFKVKEFYPNRTLDIAQSFGPPLLIAKIGLCGYVVSTQILGWVKSPEISFYYAYFTSWSLLFAMFYSITSLLNTIFPPSQPTDSDGVVQVWIQYTWVIFVLAVFCQSLAVLIFWTLVYDGGKVAYLDVATHGLVWLCIMVDGFFVNRIPLRWMHIYICWAIALVFIVWSVIHGPSVLDVGNPNEQDNDAETNDDAIYASLSWDPEDISTTVVVVAIVFFVVVPIIFCLLRFISLSNWPFCCPSRDRRFYYTFDDAENDSENSDSTQDNIEATFQDEGRQSHTK